jgi:hypothetical protein
VILSFLFWSSTTSLCLGSSKNVLPTIRRNQHEKLLKVLLSRKLYTKHSRFTRKRTPTQCFFLLDQTHLL